MGYKHPGCVECEVELPKLDGSGNVTFDWKTINNEYIEVKDINWAELRGGNLEKLQESLLKRKEIVIDQAGIYILYSKHDIPAFFRDWLDRNNIAWEIIG